MATASERKPSDGLENISKAVPEGSKPKPKSPRSRRPNYAQIHTRPLPLEVYPLPVFIPQNPFSLLQIVYTALSHMIWPPSSHIHVHKGYFSEETQSVHVTDPKSIRALWEQGFFGKGSLSRSEPRWLDQERRRRGLIAAETSEEVTRKRREERRQFKLERARKERETIEQQLRDEGKLVDSAQVDEIMESNIQANGSDGAEDVSATGHANGTTIPTPHLPEDVIDTIEEAVEEDLQDEEHLQLTPEEAFFLAYGLGSLEVLEHSSTLSTTSLLRTFCASSSSSVTSAIQPDNSFLLKYVVYHHFRSLGWVVRPGVKFAVDFLLYNRGPVFSHAEFALMIIPSYIHSYWSETPERKAHKEKMEKRDWWWLHRVNRVQTQVHKTLVLVYVDVPPVPEGLAPGGEINIGALLKRYKVREFILRRWTPNRNRG